MRSGSSGMVLPDSLEDEDDLDFVDMLCWHGESCCNWLAQGRTTRSVHFVYPLSVFPMLWCLLDTQQCCLLALKLPVEFFSSFWVHPLASLCLSMFTGKKVNILHIYLWLLSSHNRRIYIAGSAGDRGLPRTSCVTVG